MWNYHTKERQMTKKLNIGCGWYKKDGFINIDKSSEVSPDKVVDIEKGLPFGNDYFDYIYSSHVLEHISPNKFRFVLEEIARVIKDGGILELDLPFDNIGTRTNIDHYRTFSFGTFDQLYNTNLYYYFSFQLKPLHKKPIFPIRLFFYLFPIFKHNIHYKFQVLKRKS